MVRGIQELRKESVYWKRNSGNNAGNCVIEATVEPQLTASSHNCHPSTTATFLADSPFIDSCLKPLYNGHFLLSDPKGGRCGDNGSTVFPGSERQFEIPISFLKISNSMTIQGRFTWREEDPSTRKILKYGEKTFSLITCRNFGPCGAQKDKGLKMTGDNNKNAIWALLLSFIGVKKHFLEELSQL